MASISPIIKFTGQDGVDYEYSLSVPDDGISPQQLERYKYFVYQAGKIPDPSTLSPNAMFDEYREFTDIFYNFMAYDLFKAYPDHTIARRYYDKVYGLSSEGLSKLAALIGSMSNLESLIKQIQAIKPDIDNLPSNEEIIRNATTESKLPKSNQRTISKKNKTEM